MATITRLQLFAPQNVNDAAPTILIAIPTTPTSNLLINGRVRFTNHTAGAVTITAWALATGGTPGDDNIALPETSIGANSYIDVDVPQLGAGYEFQAQSGAATSITAQPIDGAIYSS